MERDHPLIVTKSLIRRLSPTESQETNVKAYQLHDFHLHERKS